MPSNIVAIKAAIAGAYAEVAELKSVTPFLPAAIDATPAHVFWQSGWRMLQATFGGMRIEWTLTGYVCMPPLNEEQTELQLQALVAAMLDELYRNLTASGTITDGQVQLEGGERMVLVVGGIPFQAQRVTYTIVESFPYAYGLGAE